MSRGARPLALLAILLLAAALRFHHLDTQSFWSDEGNSVAMVGRSVTGILSRSANDISPPLYYLALDAWGSLVGGSEFAIRTLSVIFSLMAVALTAALGRRVGGWPVALVAAFASATSPYAIHYAQEARMYGPIAALALVAWYALARLQRLPAHRGWLITYILTALAMLYTQYFTAAVLVGVNLAWLWHGWRRAEFRPAWPRWIGAQGLVALLFLPWLLVALPSILGWPAVSAPLSLDFLLRELARIFSIGMENDGLSGLATLGFALLALFGVGRALPGLWQHGRELRALPLWMMAVPPLLMLLLSLDRPFWNPKFLTIALGGFHLLLGLGSAALWAWLRRRPTLRPVASVAPAAVMLFLLWAVRPTLANAYGDPQYWRDDYRTIAQLVAARAEPNDAVILNGAGQAEIWEYYDRSGLAVYPLPPSRPLDAQETTAQLEAIAAAHPRVWVLWWAEQEGDPGGVIPAWLAEHAFDAGSRWFGDVRLASYRLAGLPPLQPVEARWALPAGGPQLALDGASHAPTTLEPGDVLALETEWRATGSEPITFFAQLLDEANQVVGQYDGDGGALPLAAWEGSQRLRMGLPVAVGTPPGEVRLVIGAYDASGQRLTLPDGSDLFTLATIPIVKPEPLHPLQALGLSPTERRDSPVGEARLVGAQAFRLGFDHAPRTPLRAGEPFMTVLFWQAQQDAPALPELTLRLRTTGGEEVTNWPWSPVTARYPPAQWDAGELVRDAQSYFLPTELAPAGYTLWLETGEQRTLIGQVRVE